MQQRQLEAVHACINLSSSEKVAAMLTHGKTAWEPDVLKGALDAVLTCTGMAWALGRHCAQASMLTASQMHGTGGKALLYCDDFAMQLRLPVQACIP